MAPYYCRNRYGGVFLEVHVALSSQTGIGDRGDPQAADIARFGEGGAHARLQRQRSNHDDSLRTVPFRRSGSTHTLPRASGISAVFFSALWYSGRRRFCRQATTHSRAQRMYGKHQIAKAQTSPKHLAETVIAAPPLSLAPLGRHMFDYRVGAACHDRLW